MGTHDDDEATGFSSSTSSGLSSDCDSVAESSIAGEGIGVGGPVCTTPAVRAASGPASGAGAVGLANGSNGGRSVRGREVGVGGSAGTARGLIGVEGIAGSGESEKSAGAGAERKESVLCELGEAGVGSIDEATVEATGVMGVLVGETARAGLTGEAGGVEKAIAAAADEEASGESLSFALSASSAAVLCFFAGETHVPLALSRLVCLILAAVASRFLSLSRGCVNLGTEPGQGGRHTRWRARARRRGRETLALPRAPR